MPGSDLQPTGLHFDSQNGGVSFGYTVTGLNTAVASKASLYWASGTTYDDRIGGPIFTKSIDKGTAAGSYGSFADPVDFNTAQAGATHLILVTDPDDKLPETDEQDNVQALEIRPDIRDGYSLHSGWRAVQLQRHCQ